MFSMFEQVDCPHCGSAPGFACLSAKGVETPIPHIVRKALALDIDNERKKRRQLVVEQAVIFSTALNIESRNDLVKACSLLRKHREMFPSVLG